MKAHKNKQDKCIKSSPINSKLNSTFKLHDIVQLKHMSY